MRSLTFLGTVLALVCVSRGGEPAPIIGADEHLFVYDCETGGRGYGDVLRLKSGAARVGKAMEWATQVLLFDGSGQPAVFDVADVKEFELRRTRRHITRPNLPDLTVAYVERLPRDPHWHGHTKKEGGLVKPDMPVEGLAWRPAVGTKVTFRIHVLNAGAAKAGEVTCKILLDGAEIGSKKLEAIAPEKEETVDASWAWHDGPHELRVEIDPERTLQEIVRWNNTFTEPVQGLGVAVVVAADRNEAFRRTPNLVDSYCFEDWIQYQIRCMNGLFKASVYPTSPQGIRERLRCDRIVVTDDPSDTRQREGWSRLLRRGGDANGAAEEASLVIYDKLSAQEDVSAAALKVDWNQLKNLGRELGLIDLRVTDTRLDQSLVVDQWDRYWVGQHLFPWPKTLMYMPGGFPLSEVCAGYLNQALGKPRGFGGEFLNQLPQQIVVDVRSKTGKPLEGVQIDAFQLQSEGVAAGALAGVGRDPICSATTDSTGRVTLPNMETPAYTTPNGYELRPNPFGKIALDGSNGLLLLRIRHSHESVLREEFHFLRLFDCLAAYLRGHHEEFTATLISRFPDAEAPMSPPYTLLVMDDRSEAMPPLKLRWRTGASLLQLEEFRIYRRIGLGADSDVPWTLDGTLRKSGKRWVLETDGTYFNPPTRDARYTPDTFLAITAVDKQGREGGLSNRAFLPFDKSCRRFAIDTDAAYMTLSGDGPVQMLRWDAIAGTQPFTVNARAVPNYKPGFGGIAVTPEHRLILTDPVNHVLALYDLNGNLEEVMPRRGGWPGYPSDEPGEFYDPADVAADKEGRLFVADRGNNRVQILDARGRFLGKVDPELNFIAPHSVAFSNGHLCVTDSAGSRVRIYKMEGEQAKFERQLPMMVAADRAILSKTGRIYLTARDPVSKKNGLLECIPEGDTVRVNQAIFQGEMGRVFDPVSAYLYDYSQEDRVYVMNKFPFDVRWNKIE